MSGAPQFPNELRSDYDTWADVYDLADADRTPYFQFYTGLIETHVRSVLELGCGTGTILRGLVERIRAAGIDVVRAVGVDLSDGMLTIARRHAPHIAFIRGDMRSPPVEGPFDFVFSCYNSLQSLRTGADLAQTFKAVRGLLSPAGIFAFDIYQPNIPYLEVAARDRLARTIVAPDGRRLEIREDSQFDPSSQILTIDWRLIDVDAARMQIAATRYRLRQFFPAEVDARLNAAGLAISQRYGDFDRSKFTATSRKQVLVCRVRDSVEDAPSGSRGGIDNSGRGYQTSGCSKRAAQLSRRAPSAGWRGCAKRRPR